MDKKVLELYKEKNPIKYAQKFGHLEQEDTSDIKTEKKAKSSILKKIKKVITNE